MISDAQFKSSALAGAVFGCLAYYTQRLRLRYSVTSTRRAREVSHWEYMWAKHAQWAGQVLSSLLPLAAWCAAVVVHSKYLTTQQLGKDRLALVANKDKILLNQPDSTHCIR